MMTDHTLQRRDQRHADRAGRSVIRRATVLICAIVACAAVAVSAALAHTPHARETGVGLQAELRGLVAMPDGPPGANPTRM